MKTETIPCEVCASPAEGNTKDGFRCTNKTCVARVEYDRANAEITPDVVAS